MPRPDLSPLLPLEVALHAVLQLDPASREALAALEGRVLQIRCSEPPLDVFLLPGRTPRLLTRCAQKPETVLEGRAADLLALFFARDRAQALVNSPVRLKGNSQLLLDIQALLGKLDPDFERPLARVVGDVAAHELGRGLRHGLKIGQRLAGSLSRSLGEYLQEEARVTPAASEVEAFIDGVQQLKQDTDRLAARLERLRRQLQGNRP